MYSLGVDPRPIARKELSIPRLAEAIHISIGNQSMRDRAALGAYIRSEDGIGQATHIIQSYLELK